MKFNKPKLCLTILFSSFLVIFIAVSVVLYAEVDESIKNDNSTLTSDFPLVNGVGGTFPAILYGDYIREYDSQTANIIYNATGSGVAKSVFFAGDTLFAASDSDVSASNAANKFLPDSVTDINSLNSTIASNARIGAHLGAVMFPSAYGALAIVYNVPDISATLSLNATVLGDIFSAKIVMWDDIAIQENNPGVTFPNSSISPVGRSSESGSTSLFTGYLAKYSASSKAKYGTTALPDWPANFVKRPTAIEILYVVETLPNSIGYVQSSDLYASSVFKIASVVNFQGNKVNPTVANIENALVVDQKEGLITHNYLQVVDSKVPTAYPLSLLTFVLMYQHYNYDPKGSNAVDCGSVVEMIKFWTSVFNDQKMNDVALDSGWIPITGILKTNALIAMDSITCDGTNVAELIRNYEEKLDFFGDVRTYFWRTSKLFNFGVAKLGAFVYVLFFTSILLVSTGALINNLLKLRRHQKVANLEKNNENKTVQKLKPMRLTTQNVISMTQVVIVATQLLYLICGKSKVIVQSSIMWQILSWIALLFDQSRAYLIVLYCFVFLWLLCLIFVIEIYPSIADSGAANLRKYGTLMSFIAVFLPNFSGLFYTAIIDSGGAVLNCRFVGSSSQNVNIFRECWSSIHWIMSFITIFLLVLFVAGVSVYSQILKQFKKGCDIHDTPWFIYIEMFLKTALTVTCYILPDTAFLIIASIFCAAFSIMIAIKNSCDRRWFDAIRASSYLSLSVIAFALLILELVIKDDDFATMIILSEVWRIAIFSLVCLLGLACLIVFSLNLVKKITAAEKLARMGEISKMFNALQDGRIQVYQSEEALNAPLTNGDSEGLILEGSGAKISGSLQIPDINHPIEEVAMASNGSAKLSRDMGMFRGSSSKEFQRSNVSLSTKKWEQMEQIIKTSEEIGLVSGEKLMSLKNALKNKDKILIFLLDRSSGNFKSFLGYLDMKIYEICDLNEYNGSSSSQASYLSAVGHTPKTNSKRQNSIAKDDAIVEEL